MTFTTFVEIFWPLLVVFLVAYVAIPLLVTVLSILHRRREVRRMHRARRKHSSTTTPGITP